MPPEDNPLMARLGRHGNLREAGQCLPELRARADAKLCEHLAQVPSGRGVPVQMHGTDADPIFVGEGDNDAARHLARQASDAELLFYPGDQHYFADNSLPPYDADATARLI
jgi:dienelactone hydrolase